MDTLKCVIVGDGDVGKTCMLVSYSSSNFPGEYIPTVFDTYKVNIMVNNKPYMLGLWDTAGQSSYDRLRPLSYPQTDVFLICFSVVCHNSYKNVKDKWYPEVQHHCKDTPKLLVGLKSDLKTDKETLENLQKENKVPISLAEGIKLQRAISAYKYIECSSKMGDGLEEVFTESVFAAKQNKSEISKKKGACTIL